MFIRAAQRRNGMNNKAKKHATIKGTKMFDNSFNMMNIIGITNNINNLFVVSSDANFPFII